MSALTFAGIYFLFWEVIIMANLGCNVNSCTHNKDNCCCLSSIHVHGNSAEKCDDTCCGNYYEASKDTMTNSCGKTPKETLNISCDATKCVYNDNKTCAADHISISGVCASDSSETVCASFKCR